MNLPRRVLRNVRLMVPDFHRADLRQLAVAAVLSIRLDRTHALNQATYFEEARAGDLANVAGAALDRFAATGLGFARNPEMRVGDAAIRNIAVFQDARWWRRSSRKAHCPRFPPSPAPAPFSPLVRRRAWRCATAAGSSPYCSILRRWPRCR